MSPTELHDRLVEAFARHDRLTVAVSGGVDSMTLAYIAHRFSGKPVAMVHATSPAVPPLATQRVKQYAEREGWRLEVVDAGEFADPAYRANPLDRCYFCKSHLYDSLQRLSEGVVLSGANLDDLGDYRPGLTAAAERQVVHPFVEAEIDKAGVRALARLHGLTDIADMPAQPCLASRVETGISIDPDDMAFIDEMEQTLRRIAGEAATVRCRITSAGVTIEVAEAGDAAMAAMAAAAKSLCVSRHRSFAGIRPYRMGSAFLKPAGAVA